MMPSTPAAKAAKAVTDAAWVRNNPRTLLLHRAKSRASAKGLPFDLTVSALHWPSHCPVLGIELAYVRGAGKRRGGRPDSPSLDRLDPARGYTVDNVRVISWRANKIKADSSLAELEKLVAYVRQETAATTPNLLSTPLKT